MSVLVNLVKEDFGVTGRGRWWRSDTHSSLVIDTEKDVFYFNSRGLRGNAVDYLMNVRGLSEKSAKEFARHLASGNPELAGHSNLQVRFDKLVDLFHSSGKTNREYWYDRKLTDKTIDSYRLGYFEGWNLIPIYNNGLFYNFQCRRDEPSKYIKLWYSDPDFVPVLFNNEILRYVDTAYIVEGMVDCILLNQEGFPCVCSTSGSNSWNTGWIKYFTNIKQIFYIADNDKAGVISAKSVSQSLGNSRVRVMRFKDKSDRYGALNFFKDGGNSSEFRSLLLEKSVYGFEKELI